MLILTSNGLSSEHVLSEAKQYTAGMSTAAIITTASVGFKEHDWNIPKIKGELHTLGLRVDFIDLEFEAPERLSGYDVIVINGGNPFYLLKHIKKWGRDNLFFQFAREKLLIGISAGSIVLQNSIALAAQYSPEMNDEIGLADLTGLCLTNCEVLPHYSRFLSIFPNFEERATNYERAHALDLFRLDDGQALFLDESRAYVCSPMQ